MEFLYLKVPRPLGFCSPRRPSCILFYGLMVRGSSAFLAIIALLVICIHCAAVPCPQMTPIRKTRASVAYDIGPSTVYAYPYAYGKIYSDNMMMWDMSMLVERNRSTKNGDGTDMLAPSCVNPSGGHGFALLDPLAPNVEGEACPGSGSGSQCGVVTSFLLVKDMECSVEEVTEPFHGFTRESVYLTMTHPQHPDFKLIAGHHLLNGSIDIYPYENNTLVVNRYTYAFQLTLCFHACCLTFFTNLSLPGHSVFIERILSS